MAAGPHEERLRTYLDPARRWQVCVAKEQWRRGGDQLQAVADAIQEARPLARANLGTHTADAADQAFVAMHDKVLTRAQQMRDGALALQAAIEAICRAETVRNGFDAAGPLSEPSFPDWDEDEVRQIQQMKVHNAQMSSYDRQVTSREEAALAAIRDLDSTNESSAETMRTIQGDRPDVPSGCGAGGGGGDGGGGLPTTGGRTPVPGGRTNPPTNPPTDPPTNQPTNPPTDPEPELPGETGTQLGPVTGSTPVASGAGTIGGLAAAVGGGLAGGAMAMGGAIRGGGPTDAASGTSGTSRAIGSSGRTGSTGALGRGPAAGSTAGRSPAARGAGGRVVGAATGAGGRGTSGSKAGGRGSGPGAAGGAGGSRGRRSGDVKAVQVEAITDDQDWVDDEDAAPGVIS